MNERTFIESIRNDYRSNNERNRSNLMSSLRLLSTDLYEKDTHFIFELIQNAEDNAYAPGAKPSLRFTLRELNGTAGTVRALILENNERGFSNAQVDAICKIGQSTKAGSKAAGYIGEKGIGFKSVFRISDCPTIYSNGFQFSLPKNEPETGLGYIVPVWQDQVPTFVRPDWTTIILPLSSEGAMQVTQDALENIALETLMFLHKLRAIDIEVSLPSGCYELSIEKDEETKPLVELVYQERDEEGETLESRMYWVATQEFERPSGISDEGRTGIDKREVSVAIPLSGDGDDDKLFAYLPVWTETGIPFLINADFQLTSSREGVHTSMPWNQWLRDCIPHVYIEGFVAALESSALNLEQKARLYASIPLSTSQSFLAPLVEVIQDRLRDELCVLCWKSEHGRRPEEVRLAPEWLYDLLADADRLPAGFMSSFELGHPKLRPLAEQLGAIGVEAIGCDELLDGLDDPEWMDSRSLEWFIDLFRFLSAMEESDETRLRELSVIPVMSSEGAPSLSCDKEQPIYFPGDTEAEDLLRQVPDWLAKWVPMATVVPAFMDLIQSQDDAEGLEEWMTEALNVYSFSLSNYCVDLKLRLMSSHDELSDAQLLEATRFLVDHAGDSFSWEGLPILLADGTRGTLRGSSRMVVPAAYNPDAGWQHIWVTSDDRRHFKALADGYSDFPYEWFQQCRIAAFPSFARVTYWDARECRTQAERDLFQECHQAASRSNRGGVHVVSHECPSALLTPTINANTARAILGYVKSLNVSSLHWGYSDELKHGHGIYAKGLFRNYGDHQKFADGPVLDALKSLAWIPTTKGLMSPACAFLPSQGIKSLLGDTAAYTNSELPTNLLMTLGVHSDVTPEDVIQILISLSDQGPVEPELIRRLYEALYHRWRVDKQIDLEAFSSHELLFIPGAESGTVGLWRSIDACVWRDSGEELKGELACLEKPYPTMREFFVEALGVKEQLDKEVFARHWLTIQDGPAIDPEKANAIVGRLYRELRPIALMEGAKRPEWWAKFHLDAKIFTQAGVFARRDKLVVPDNVELRKAIEEADIHLDCAWRPDKDSFSDWQPFFDTFEVPMLSACVAEKLHGHLEHTPAAERIYVTDAAILLCAAWLREEQASDYERLRDNGMFKFLLELKEAAMDEDANLMLTLSLAGTEQHLIRPAKVFWDRKENILAYSRHDSPRLIKQQIATVLAKQLLGNRAYKRFADWIELVLEESDTHRLESRGWNAPTDILRLVRQTRKSAPEPVTEPISTSFHPSPAVQAGETPHVPAHEASSSDNLASDTDAPRDKASAASFSDILTQAFNRKGRESLNEQVTEQDYYGSTRVGNVNRRAAKLSDKMRQSLDSEPSPSDRRVVTERSILEGPDPMVRETLLEWYQGKCQICGHTWPDRSGQPYFVAAHIEDRKTARWLDNVANALCLCAEHFAQWRHASIVALVPIEDQLDALHITGDDQDLILEFQMLGQQHRIKYCEKHLLALKVMLDVAR